MSAAPTPSAPLPSVQSTIGELVRERPARARLFEMLGIDYCCGGRKTLSEACQKLCLDPQQVARAIAREDQTPAAPERDWTRASMSELADHIEQTHHAALKRELPRLIALTRKVAGAHGRAHPELMEVAAVFASFAEDLTDHMQKEEQVLFPAIRALEPGPGRAPAGPTLDTPISVLIHEHEEAGAALSTLRELTRGYAVPDGACNSYRAMLDGLAELERETHRHVHKENNILFPAAIAAQARG